MCQQICHFKFSFPLDYFSWIQNPCLWMSSSDHSTTSRSLDTFSFDGVSFVWCCWFPSYCGMLWLYTYLLLENLCLPALLFTIAYFQWLIGTDKWLLSRMCGLPNPPGSQYITRTLPWPESSTHFQDLVCG